MNWEPVQSQIVPSPEFGGKLLGILFFFQKVSSDKKKKNPHFYFLSLLTPSTVLRFLAIVASEWRRWNPPPLFFGMVSPFLPLPLPLIASLSPLFCWVICCATQSMSAQNATGSESQSTAPCRGISGRYSAFPPFWEMTNLIFSPSPSYLQLKCPNDNNAAALPVVRQCPGAKWPRLSQRLFKCHSEKSWARASPSDI